MSKSLIKVSMYLFKLKSKFDPKIFSHCKASLSKIMNIFPYFSCSTFVAHCAHTAQRLMQESTATKWRHNKPERKSGAKRVQVSGETRKLNFYCFHTNKIK